MSKQEEEGSFIQVSCKTYDNEYKTCSKFMSKFYERYASGSAPDCNIFKNLQNDCELWNKELNEKSLRNIINYEKSLQEKRKKLSADNDVWSYRDTPPYDWNSKLPQWAENRIKSSSWFAESNASKNEDKKL